MDIVLSQQRSLKYSFKQSLDLKQERERERKLDKVLNKKQTERKTKWMKEIKFQETTNREKKSWNVLLSNLRTLDLQSLSLSRSSLEDATNRQQRGQDLHNFCNIAAMSCSYERDMMMINCCCRSVVAGVFKSKRRLLFPVSHQYWHHPSKKISSIKFLRTSLLSIFTQYHCVCCHAW